MKGLLKLLAVSGAMIQLVGNIILLSPIVIFLEIFTRGRINAFKEVIIVFACSFVIEIIQLIVTIATKYPGHIADVDDLIINILGVIITVFAVKFFEEKKLAYGLVKKLFIKNNHYRGVTSSIGQETAIIR